jgi:hypothetical protein
MRRPRLQEVAETLLQENGPVLFVFFLEASKAEIVNQFAPISH